jgi:DNA-binding CsgD family transcriptional regulator
MPEQNQSEGERSDVVRRLDAIISLLSQVEGRTVRQSILALSRAGLRPFEIARILGKEQATVRGELSRAKSKRRMQANEEK